MPARSNWIVNGLGGLFIVGVAFWVTLRVLDYVGGPQASMRHASTINSAPPPANVVLRNSSVINDLPKISAVGSYAASWDGIVGLNAQPSAEAAAVSGQTVLKLVATPDNALHRLSIRIDGVPQDVTNGIQVWVKPGQINRMTVEAHDDNSRHYGAVSYDLAARTVLFSARDAQTASISASNDGWVVAKFGLPTAKSSLFIYVRLINADNAPEFSGDGRQGLTFGGLLLGP